MATPWARFQGKLSFKIRFYRWTLHESAINEPVWLNLAVYIPLQLIYRLQDFTVRAFFFFFPDKPFLAEGPWSDHRLSNGVSDTPGSGGKWKWLLSAGIPWRFHFELGPLLLSAAVAVNWKCQTCRLTVASRVCVINRTSHGTPNERVVSIRTETDPTIGQWLKNITIKDKIISIEFRIIIKIRVKDRW